MRDDPLITAFESCSIPNEHFHHADHVRMGFAYLCRFPALEAIARFSEALKRFAAHCGRPNLYHETITWAFLLLIRERVARWERQHGCPPAWNEFAATNADLLDWKDNILAKYYRPETLASELARTTFVFPDGRLQ